MNKQVICAFAMFSVGLLTSGCVSAPVPVYSGPILEQKSIVLATNGFSVVNKPVLQVAETCELGDTMISRVYAKSTPAVKLVKPVSHVTTNHGVPMRWDVASGVLKKIGEDEQGIFYSSSEFYRTLPTINSREKNLGGVYVPKQSDSQMLVYWSPREITHAFVDKSGETGVIEAVAPVVELSPDNQKKELIYTGVSKNVVSLLYREYQNDMARPAFTQELKYDLAEGRVIGFKGARFEVMNATNTGIKYKVLRHLD